MKFLKSFILVLFISVLISCGGINKINFSKNYKHKKIKNVAILDFRESFPDISGSYIADKFATYLLDNDKFKLIDRTDVKRIIQEIKYQFSGVVDEKTRHILKQLGADAVITGTLIKYYQENGRNGFVRYAKVHLLAKMIDVETGEILWSAEIAKDSRGKHEGKKKFIGGESSAKSKEELLNEIIEDMTNSLKGGKKYILF